jgi:hypothetical protein
MTEAGWKPALLGSGEHPADLFAEGGEGEGFLEEADAVVGGEFGDGALVVTTHEDDGEVRGQCAEGAEGFLAAHARHGQIKEDEGDGGLVALKQVKAFGSVGGGEGFEAEGAEHLVGDGTHAVFIIDEEDGAGEGMGRVSKGVWLSRAGAMAVEAGSRRVKEEPMPTVLETRRLPW